MKELNLKRKEIDGTLEPDIDFWALKQLSFVGPSDPTSPTQVKPQILIDQNNIYLGFENPEDLAAFKAHMAKNGVEIVEEQTLICG